MLSPLCRRSSRTSGLSKRCFRMIRRFVIDIADKLRQVCMPDHLPNRHIFASVIPVVVNDSLEQVARGEVCYSVFEVVNLLKALGGEGVQKRVYQVRNGLPGFPHLGKWWGGGW